MRRFLLALSIASSSCFSAAESYRLGLYMQGVRLGYSVYSSRPEKYDQQNAVRADDEMIIDATMLGQTMKMTQKGTTWTVDGKPKKMIFTIESQGRTQKVTAVFNGKTAHLDIENGGELSKKDLPMPTDAPVVDDALRVDLLPGGKAASFYILDPTTADFVKNTIAKVGPSSTVVNKVKVSGTEYLVHDPRADTRIWIDGKGELLKAEGPFGMEMIPEKEAPKSNPARPVTIDIASASSIAVDKPFENPRELREVKLKISGHDLAALPSDSHQTVQKDGDAWIVTVHPTILSASGGLPIGKAVATQSKWLSPSMDISSSDAKIKKIAKKLVANHTRVREAALAIRKYVNDLMVPNAGIGVVRDAREVLKTHEGVCRDYAILTASLLRAGGIPAKVASGLVYADGRYYYHAWALAWDGSRWIGIDSTLQWNQITATHIELSVGNVEQAFLYTVLDGVKIEVLSAR